MKKYCLTGFSRTKEYRAWVAMRQRCSKTYVTRPENYIGRGIMVCERWEKSFPAFLQDMGKAPAGQSLDRIDNDRGYEPGNCKWSTPREQANNRRNSIWLSFNGETKTLAEWARSLGVKDHTLRKRIRRVKTLDRALLINPPKGD